MTKRKSNLEAESNTTALAPSGDLFRALFESLPDLGIVCRLSDSICVDVNESFLYALGCRRDQIIGTSIADSVLWSDSNDYRRLQSALVEHGHCSNEPVRCRLANGSLHSMQVTGRVVTMEHDRYATWFIRDLEHRNLKEDRLQTKLDDLQQIFDIALDLVVIMDTSSRIFRLNREWDQVLGYPAGELEGKKFQDLVHPDDHLPGATVLKALASGENIVGFLNRVRHRDGSYRWIEWRAAPYRDTLVFATARDLTDRITYEEILRENSFLLSESQRVARLGSYIFDLNAGRWTSSEMLDRIYGIGPDFDRTVGGWSSLIHASDRDDAILHLKKSLTGSLGFNREFRIVRQNDGEIRWVHGLGELVTNEEGRPVKLIGVVQDITERKRAEEAVTEATQRRQALFEQARDSIFIVGAQDGAILDVNSEVERLLGQSRSELIGRNLMTIHPSDQVDRMTDLFRDVVSSNRQGMFEGELLDAAGRRIPVEISASLIELFDGRQVVQGFVRDITERKRSQEALRQSEERFRTAFQTSPDAVAITRLRDGVYVDINESFTAITGYHWDEVIGFNSPELGIFTDPADREQMLAVLHAEGVVQNFETVLRMKNGALRTGHLSARVLNLNGELFVLTIARDVTEQKIAHDELRRSREQLRRLTQHIESTREEERKWIAREIHDELGQLLTALKLDLSWLKKRLPSESAELFDKAMGMNSLVESAMQSIKRILFQLRPVPLGDVGFEAALEWLIQDFRARTGLECESRLKLANEIVDTGRSTAIFRILQEALNNIVRHARATKVTIELTGNRRDLVLRIEDNGIGIRTSDEHKMKSFGIVGMRERARFFGGDVEIRPRNGSGTVVTATIPIKEGLPDDSDSHRR